MPCGNNVCVLCHSLICDHCPVIINKSYLRRFGMCESFFVYLYQFIIFYFTRPKRQLTCVSIYSLQSIVFVCLVTFRLFCGVSNSLTRVPRFLLLVRHGTLFIYKITICLHLLLCLAPVPIITIPYLKTPSLLV